MSAGSETPWVPEEGEILSVGDLAERARQLLERAFSWVWVEGEMGNVRVPASGHAYFTLSDDRAQLRAVCFRATLRLLGRGLTEQLRDGLRVLARGRLTVYEARGDLQLVVEDLQPEGEGLLRLELEARKRRLAAEGLFDPARKRPLPPLPRAVGVVTSPTGAAVRDVLQVLRRRAPGVHVCLAPARVQGEEAPRELLEALDLAASHPEVDVVVIARGGGSAEDLAAFNDEELVRGVARCRVPVISGVGHETDVTLVDFAADLRAPTPSAAAELAVREWGHWVERVERAATGLGSAFRTALSGFRQRLELADPLRRSPAARIARLRIGLDRADEALGAAAAGRLLRERSRIAGLETRLFDRAPYRRVGDGLARLARLEDRMAGAVRAYLEARRGAVAVREAELRALSPLAVLRRGYAVAWNGAGEIVRDALQCAVGEDLSVRVARGEFGCRVTSVRSGPEEV